MIASLNRTLDQELAALVRGASLECLVCGEFVLRVREAVACPECGSILAEGFVHSSSVLAEGWEVPEIELPSVVQAG